MSKFDKLLDLNVCRIYHIWPIFDAGEATVVWNKRAADKNKTFTKLENRRHCETSSRSGIIEWDHLPSWCACRFDISRTDVPREDFIDSSFVSKSFSRSWIFAIKIHIIPIKIAKRTVVTKWNMLKILYPIIREYTQYRTLNLCST